MVAAHGVVVIHGLERGWKNMDNIRDTYSELSHLHSEKLHVDPDNFKARQGDLLVLLLSRDPQGLFHHTYSPDAGSASLPASPTSGSALPPASSSTGLGVLPAL
ncbi:hemoglobin subunit beta-1-like [Osmerus eperlanus]|uniref:hemoglobin subunit beta-1-like n=1 Tax=Osmerus eperlanus TaxID=29151 RepID=UPI002E0E1BB5